MADDNTEEEELQLEAQEAGVAFRAEMWLTDALLGYWMYVLGALVIGLASIFFYSLYRDHKLDQQGSFAEEVSRVESRLDGDIAQLAYLEASGQTLDQAKLMETAQALEAIPAYGAGHCEALLKAAEIYRLAGRTDDQRRVLEAVEAEGIEPFVYLASSSLANLDLEAGANDAAIQRLSDLVARHDGFLGEQSAIDLGLVYEQLGRNEDARSVYLKFEERWKTSPRLEQVKKRLDALGAG
ncbi:MAG: tetratricopeptide repeat protein [Alphaproteobacteria bacterium]|nr:tetratricopeptide repeat protein [Alphaproteobacteria bacterium]MCB9690565.1 tetratricopeptide repeat protein [Alphaproteobacteria bacterium]